MFPQVAVAAVCCLPIEFPLPNFWRRCWCGSPTQGIPKSCGPFARLCAPRLAYRGQRALADVTINGVAIAIAAATATAIAAATATAAAATVFDAYALAVAAAAAAAVRMCRLGCTLTCKEEGRLSRELCFRRRGTCTGTLTHVLRCWGRRRGEEV